jgi:hypothetical protein
VGARCGAVHLVFDSYVDLHIAHLEPEATSPDQRRRLGDFAQAEHPAVEDAGRIFGADGDTDLGVIQPADHHRFVPTVSFSLSV